jgi:hypothetical protein
MPRNMSSTDRGLRFVAGVAAVVAGAAIGPGSAVAIALFVVAGVLLATSAVGFCPLYALVRFDSRGHRPLPH